MSRVLISPIAPGADSVGARSEWRWVEGGVMAPIGFVAVGVACGLKQGGKLDFALLRSDPPATAAAIFTTNSVKAAPVLFDREVLRSGRPVSLVVANSKVANACTGAEGVRAARATAAAVLAETRAPGAAFVLSTGIIGRQLDMERIRAGIRLAAAELRRPPDSLSPDGDGSRPEGSPDGRAADSSCGGDDAARAIMTTDTFPKSAALWVPLSDGSGFTIGGMAKGAGMIHPNMATMLAVLTTDAAVEPGALQSALRYAADRSFHAISVDGDSSTNDTVLLLANSSAMRRRSGRGRLREAAYLGRTNGDSSLEVGRNGNLNPRSVGEPLTADSPGYVIFRDALTRLCIRLARWIVADGEGARRLIEIRVAGAKDDDAARAIGRVIATSSLVKTALGASDPNWGRIAAAAGRSGESVDPDALAVGFASSVGRVEVMRNGEPLTFSEEAARRILQADEIRVEVIVGGGPGMADVWTCDLSEEYVRINSAYRT